MLVLFTIPTIHAQVFPYAFSTFVEDYEDLGPDATTVEIGMEGLPSGIYQLLIRDGNARVVRSLVKQ